ncbi:hypothetical protein [Aerococcus urinaehominis]|nr:hypothetical protein [Aerococcus urinaehominis]
MVVDLIAGYFQKIVKYSQEGNYQSARQELANLINRLTVMFQ